MKRILPLLALAFAVTACQDDGPTVPLDSPDLAQGGGQGPGCDNPPCKDGDGTVTESAAGEYWMTVYLQPNGPLQNRRARFEAVRYEDGTVAGEWLVERYSVSSGRRVSKSNGEISCFTISGDGAWLGGTEKGMPKSVNQVVWRVVDGALADESSLACNRLPGVGCGYAPLDGWTAERYCDEIPMEPPLLPIDSGAIDISR